MACLTINGAGDLVGHRRRIRKGGWLRWGAFLLLSLPGLWSVTARAGDSHPHDDKGLSGRKAAPPEANAGIQWSTVVPFGSLPPLPGPHPFVDWANLKNPILARPDRAIKDQAVAYQDGWFYLFASERVIGSGPRSRYRTRDFKTYEAIFDQVAAANSPDISHYDGRYYLILQAPAPGAERRIYYTTSTNLLDWTPRIPLAGNIQPGLRQIDGALAKESGRYFLGYKGDQTFYVTTPVGLSLDGPWREPLKVRVDGWCENFQLIKIDGLWRLLATSYAKGRLGKRYAHEPYAGNHETYIYTMAGSGGDLEDFARWKHKRHLKIPREDWNGAMRDNCGYLCDWRTHDGYFYLFYAGANDVKSFDRRGHDKIGVARSRDLVHWRLPGDMR